MVRVGRGWWNCAWLRVCMDRTCAEDDEHSVFESCPSFGDVCLRLYSVEHIAYLIGSQHEDDLCCNFAMSFSFIEDVPNAPLFTVWKQRSRLEDAMLVLHHQVSKSLCPPAVPPKHVLENMFFREA